MVCASRFDFSTIDWSMFDCSTIAPARDLSLGYLSFFLADLNYVSNFPLQIALHAEKYVSLIIDRDALHVFQLAPERGDCFQLFTGSVDVELAVMTIGDVQP